MSVRVRLTRVGSKKNPIWRVVVADQRSPRDGRFIETIGHYNPQTEPSTIRIDSERYEHWVARGAEASNTVKQLMKAQTKSGGPTPLDAPAATVVAEPPAEAETDAEPSEETIAEVAEGVAEAGAPEAETGAEPEPEAASEPGDEGEPDAGEDEPSS
jgi:small subunit ribosomal protein S16